jgi:putative PIN family toxin of toxin-antitoxin system
VIISGLLFPGSLPGKAFTIARDHGDVLHSAETLAELVEVLRRPRFNRYLTSEERDRFLAALIREATICEPTDRILACRYPKDDKWLELAIVGAVECLITGNADLLALGGFRGVTIVTPAMFVESHVE